MYFNCTINRFNLAVASLYVRKHYDGRPEKIVDDIFTDVDTEFLHILKTVPWLDNKTRTEAIHKLDRMTYSIGHAEALLNDTYLDTFYAPLNIHVDDFFHSILNINSFFAEKEHFKSLRSENAAQIEVNAYYVYSSNHIGAYTY